MENICKLCLKLGKSADCLERNVLNNMLKSLSLKVRHSDRSTLCSGCIQKVNNIFSFKSNCCLIEEGLSAYISSSVPKVDLRKYLVDEGYIDDNNNQDSFEPCRLCRSMTHISSVTPLRDLLEIENMKKIFHDFIPELNLEATENPLVCEMCQTYLRDFHDLICMDTDEDEENSNLVKEEKESPNNTVDADLEGDIPIFFVECVTIDETAEKVKVNGQELHDTSDQVKAGGETVEKTCNEMKETSTGKKMRINPCEIKSTIRTGKKPSNSKATRLTGTAAPERKRLEQHSSWDEAELKSAVYSCKNCSFITSHVSDLSLHTAEEKSGTKIVGIFECILCDLKTQSSVCLKTHMDVLHLHKSTPVILQCKLCGYITWQLNKLEIHFTTVHATYLKTMMKECKFCNYVTKYQDKLTAHVKLHPPSAEPLATENSTNDQECTVTRIKRKRRKRTKSEQMRDGPKRRSIRLAAIEAQKIELIPKNSVENEPTVANVDNESNVDDAKNESSAETPANVKGKRIRHSYYVKKHTADIHNITGINRFGRYDCLLCNSGSHKHMQLLGRHIRKRHTIVSYVKIKQKYHKVLTCRVCAYKTTHDSDIYVHLGEHKKPRGRTETEKPKIFECPTCDLKVGFLWGLKAHLRNNCEHYSECELADCKFCEFVIPTELEMLVNSLELSMKECEKCSYTTKYPPKFNRHMLLHDNPSETFIKPEGFTTEKQERQNKQYSVAKSKLSTQSKVDLPPVLLQYLMYQI